jgi:hypothetical protein
VYVRISALLIALATGTLSSQIAVPVSRLDLPLEQRLDLPQRIASVPLRLTDFVSFIAVSFKVPLLVETPSPIPDLEAPDGTYSARQLLNLAMHHLPDFEWKDEGGVAHIYDKRLVRSSGNLLNVRVHQFAFPYDVGEFMYLFPHCISATLQGYDCRGGLYTGFKLPQLKQGQLPFGQNFDGVLARDIILAALKANRRFYVLIAFEGSEPKLKSQFPFQNWFAESLEVPEPSPLWVQTPRTHGR